MGYLDHSTNNIILDAVLTDYGRQKLAQSGGNFNISRFSFGDDEVDYRIIKKYGRTTGKEKIEKNTPIFEALTNPSIALKYKLIGIANDGVVGVYLPEIRLRDASASFDLNKNKTQTSISLDLYFKGSSSVPPEMIQQNYTIKVSDRFFVLKNSSSGAGGSLNETPVLSNDPSRIATYKFSTSRNSSSITFDVLARSTIDNTTLSIYGKNNGSARVITSYVTVIGENHGCSIDIPVTYTASLV